MGHPFAPDRAVGIEKVHNEKPSFEEKYAQEADYEILLQFVSGFRSKSPNYTHIFKSEPRAWSDSYSLEDNTKDMDFWWFLVAGFLVVLTAFVVVIAISA